MPLMMNIMSFNQDKQLKQKQKMEHQNFSHFSHRHPLELSNIHEEDKAVCSGCELDIVGPTYICTKPTCTFLLHDLCFDLPQNIRHFSHPKHPLKLLPSPPYGDGEFTCDACAKSGHGFTYHCVGCKFDLHVECASLPEIEKRDDHRHPLMLLCDRMEGQDSNLCYVCNGYVAKGCWSYCCLACKCVAHLECGSQ